MLVGTREKNLLTSLHIEGRTLSSKSWPSCLYIVGNKVWSGRASTLRDMLTICKSVNMVQRCIIQCNRIILFFIETGKLRCTVKPV